MSFREQEALARGFVGAVSRIVGPTKDTPAPYVYTNALIMSWMYDEYRRIWEYFSPNFTTGKPLVLGGSAGCEKTTALSICVAAREAAKTRNQEIE